MKLFTVGPVEMYPETLASSALQLPYFRTAEYSEIMLESERMMLELSGAPAGSRAVFLTASGTGAMEAAVMNLLRPSDAVMVVDGGSFGHRFVQMCDSHGIPQRAVRLAFGKTLVREMLDENYQPGMTALLVNLDETSIGQLYDVDMLGTFCREHDMLLIVDAISAFLADEIDMARSGIDALIVSSQKALALAPGASVVVLSPRGAALARERGSEVMYFDFRDYLKNGDRGQPPFTPAVGIFLTMHARLKGICEQGLDTVRAAIRRQAEDFREKVRALDVDIPGYPLSNALTPLYFPEGNAGAVYRALREEYGLTVTPNGGALADYLLRVGHMGDLCPADNDELVRAMGAVLAR